MKTQLKRSKSDKIKAVFGAILFFPILVLFFLDRLILLFLFWQNSPSIQEYFKKMEHIKLAMYRVGAVTGAYYIIHLFIYIF